MNTFIEKRMTFGVIDSQVGSLLRESPACGQAPPCTARCSWAGQYCMCAVRPCKHAAPIMSKGRPNAGQNDSPFFLPDRIDNRRCSALVALGTSSLRSVQTCARFVLSSFRRQLSARQHHPGLLDGCARACDGRGACAQVVKLGSSQGLAWQPAFGITALMYFYSHYFFASGAAHIGAMYTAFLSVAIASGTPPMFAALALGQLSNLMGCLTTYGIGSAPPYFGAGYVTQAKWYQLGLILSVWYLTVWCFAGGAWWKVIGLW